eukprot:6492770-Amphidinium_carterae.1
MSLGTKAVPDLQSIAAQYKQHRSQGSLEALGAQEAGHMSTRVQRLCRRFGVFAKAKKSRALNADKGKMRAQSFLAQHVGDDIVSRALAITAEHKNGEEAEAVAFARSVKFHASKQKIHGMQQKKQTFDKYAATVGLGKIQGLQAKMPVFESVSMACIPLPGLNMFHVQPDEVIAKSVRSAATLSGNKSTNIGPCLDRLWTEMHQTLAEEQVLAQNAGEAAEVDLHASMSTTPCYSAGLCLCCSEGKKLKQLHNNFLKYLKETYATKEAKQLLSGGMVVLHMKMSTHGLAQMSSLSEGTAEYFWHVACPLGKRSVTRGRVHFKPDVLSIGFPDRRSSTIAFSLQLDGLHVLPKATGEYCQDLIVLQELLQSENVIWEIATYSLVVLDSPLSYLQPCSILVQPYKTLQRLFPIERRTRTRRDKFVATDDPWGMVSAAMHGLSMGQTQVEGEDVEEEVDEAVANLPDAIDDGA